MKELFNAIKHFWDSITFAKEYDDDSDIVTFDFVVSSEEERDAKIKTIESLGYEILEVTEIWEDDVDG